MVNSWGKMTSVNLENRLTRREFLGSIGALAALAAGCGERMIPEPGPYELLDHRWIRDDVIQVDSQDVSRTISFIFHESQIYTYSEIGKRSSDQVEVLNYAEQGTYEVIVPETSNFEGTMTLTPIGTDKEPYTVDWYIRKPGDGNLILTYSDGKMLDLKVYRRSNN